MIFVKKYCIVWLTSRILDGRIAIFLAASSSWSELRIVCKRKQCYHFKFGSLRRFFLCWDLLDREWKVSKSFFLWFWKVRMEKFHSHLIFLILFGKCDLKLFFLFLCHKNRKIFFSFILAIFTRIFSFCDPIFCLCDCIFCLC